MHFEENQLSPGLIGLSPLSTGHPSGFQPTRVRSSTRSYPRFNLPMDRSPGFGSCASDSTPYSDSLSLRLPHNGLTSPPTQTRRLILQKARRHQPHQRRDQLRRLVGTRFQVLFHSPPGVLFTIPSRYYPLSVIRKYLALRGGPRRFTQDFTGPTLLGKTSGRRASFTYRALTFYGRPFQTVQLPARFLTPRQGGSPAWTLPPPRHRNTCQLSTAPV